MQTNEPIVFSPRELYKQPIILSKKTNRRPFTSDEMTRKSTERLFAQKENILYPRVGNTYSFLPEFGDEGGLYGLKGIFQGIVGDKMKFMVPEKLNMLFYSKKAYL